MKISQKSNSNSKVLGAIILFFALFPLLSIRAVAQPVPSEGAFGKPSETLSKKLDQCLVNMKAMPIAPVVQSRSDQGSGMGGGNKPIIIPLEGTLLSRLAMQYNPIEAGQITNLGKTHQFANTEGVAHGFGRTWRLIGANRFRLHLKLKPGVNKTPASLTLGDSITNYVEDSIFLETDGGARFEFKRTSERGTESVYATGSVFRPLDPALENFKLIGTTLESPEVVVTFQPILTTSFIEPKRPTDFVVEYPKYPSSLAVLGNGYVYEATSISLKRHAETTEGINISRSLNSQSDALFPESLFFAPKWAVKLKVEAIARSPSYTQNKRISGISEQLKQDLTPLDGTTTVTYPYKFEYSSQNGELIKITMPSGRAVNIRYHTDSSGKETLFVKEVSHINGTTEQFCYAPNGAITWYKDGLNNVTSYIYDKSYLEIYGIHGKYREDFVSITPIGEVLTRNVISRITNYNKQSILTSDITFTRPDQSTILIDDKITGARNEVKLDSLGLLLSRRELLAGRELSSLRYDSRDSFRQPTTVSYKLGGKLVKQIIIYNSDGSPLSVNESIGLQTTNYIYEYSSNYPNSLLSLKRNGKVVQTFAGTLGGSVSNLLGERTQYQRDGITGIYTLIKDDLGREIYKVTSKEKGLPKLVFIRGIGTVDLTRDKVGQIISSKVTPPNASTYTISFNPQYRATTDGLKGLSSLNITSPWGSGSVTFGTNSLPSTPLTWNGFSLLNQNMTPRIQGSPIRP